MLTKDARKSLAAIEDSVSRVNTGAIELTRTVRASSSRALIQLTYLFAFIYGLFGLIIKAAKENLGSSCHTLMEFGDDVACGFLEQTGN